MSLVIAAPFVPVRTGGQQLRGERVALMWQVHFTENRAEALHHGLMNRGSEGQSLNIVLSRKGKHRRK